MCPTSYPKTNNMKKIILMVTFFLTIVVFKNADAQVRLSTNVNIGSQLVLGPVGYDHVEYYCLPDVDMYYYVTSQQFV